MIKSEKNALLSTVSLRSLAITGVALASLTLVGACGSVGGFNTADAQPAAAASPCNPCAAAAGNPCAAANPCNPCAASANPCAAAANPCNPCALSANPCGPSAADNPCAAQTVARGPFYHANGHQVSGNAHISKGPDGTYRLKFTQFASDWGPDINIILSPAHAPKTSSAIKQAGYITVAPRKALTGDQSYPLPKDFDPRLYQSVGIWCEAFGVLFGAAQLQTL